MRAGFDPRRLHHWIAFGGGAGLAPWAPGTVGTLAALPLYWLMMGLSPLGYGLALLALTLLGIWACDRTARDLGVSDPSAIVWDEVAGFLLTMAAAPPGWPWLVAGFALFRLFDIWKPWPIGWLDRTIPGGLGIMVDDLAAGAMAWAVLHLAALYLPSW